MEERNNSPDPAGKPAPGSPHLNILHVIIALAVIVLAVVLIAKFGYNTDLLNPAGGQMSLVQRQVSTVKVLNTYQNTIAFRVSVNKGIYPILVM